MRKWIPVVLVFILAFTGIWFWSLGSLPSDDVTIARVSEKTGGMQLVRDNQAPQEIGVDTALLEGDRITTGAEGSAILDWYGAGESRISTSTEIVIEKLGQTEDGNLLLVLRLESGRIWSRVQSLLDLDAQATVQTSDVIATVRGTSFDLEKHVNEPTTLWVSDSVVETSGASVASTGDGLLVLQGSMAKFGGAYRTTSTIPISASGTQTEWFLNNKENDKKFDAKNREKQRSSLGLGRAPASGLLRGLADLSQKLRGPSAGPRLIMRRLALIRDEAETGAEGKAADDFTRLERELRQQIDTAKPAIQASLRKAVRNSRKLFADVNPESPAYRYKQALEEISERFARTDAERIFLRLLAVNDRLDEGFMALENGNSDLAGSMAGIAEQSLTNLAREMKELKDKEGKAVMVRSKMRALSARTALLRARANPPPVVLPELPTSTNMLIETTPQVLINGKPL